MGFFSWNCKGCNASIKAPYGLPKSIAWQNDATILMRDGTRVHGHYDGYGRISCFEITDYDDIEWWHQKCWKEAGKPEFTGPSTHAQDQGYFYDHEDEEENEDEEN